MQLPFTHDAFLDVFGRYNTSLWLPAAALWAVTAVFASIWLGTGRITGRAGFGLLAVHWLWSGLVYHWLFFRTINPAAAAFAVLFVVQGVWFAWLAISGRGVLMANAGLRRLVSAGLVVYGLAYPAIGLAAGLQYPRLPLFAVPCPTALVTAGWLISAAGVPRLVNAGTILWAVIGGSAAFVLGIHADFALVVAGAVLTIDSIAPYALGPRPLL